MNCKLTDFSALSLKLLLFTHLIILSNNINNEVNKRNPEKVYHYEDQSLMPSTSKQYASLGLQLLIMTLQLRKLRYENQNTLQFRQLNVH